MKDPYRILAVDDEKFNLLLLQSCLKGENCTLVTCTDAASAIGEFKKGQTDIVLLDIMLGSIDGFEVRKLIREYNPKIPIIFLTSLMEDMDSTLLTRIASDQFSYYLNKSFQKKLLLDTIEHAVNIYREETALSAFYQQVEADLKLAWEVQRLMLPRWCEVTPKMLSSYCYRPCFTVSGDIFTKVPLADGRVLTMIGDISGHGVQAALYMSAVQSFFKTLVSELRPEDFVPHLILNRINRFFSDDLVGENYMTCLVALFDFEHNKVIFQSAGHPGLICCRPKDGIAFEIDCGDKGNIPIGWSRQEPYVAADNVEFEFEDDTLFLGYTDGLTDLRNAADESVGLPTVLELVGPMAAESNWMAIPFRLSHTLVQIGYEKINDDISVIVIGKNHGVTPAMSQAILPDIREVERYVKEFGRFTRGRTDDEYLSAQVELLLSEFINNIIIHGLSGRKTAHMIIGVAVTIREDAVIVSVCDRGGKWDGGQPSARGDANAALERLNENRATSGRGLPIIWSIVDSIQRKYYNDLNETDFIIKREQQKESQ